jgi:thiamine-monophosphate kinase
MAFERPTARVGEAAVLARHGASAMIDVSDGLALDLVRLCEASHTGARVTLASLPLGPGATLDDALAGGEDYELLAAVPGDAVAAAASELRETFGVPLAEIGVIIEEGVSVIDSDGRERPLEAVGWDHFGG